MNIQNCITCDKVIKPYKNPLKCSICNGLIHLACAKISKNIYNKNVEKYKNYCCYKCLNQLPFQCIDDNEFKYLNCQLNINSKLYEIYNKCTEFNFKSFSSTDYTHFDFENDVDPENNFYNNIDINCNNYYTDCQFKENITKVNGVSLIHFNARGLNKNLNEINSYLSQLNYYFDVIAISETGVKEHCIDNFDLDGYNVQHVCRKKYKKWWS